MTLTLTGLNYNRESPYISTHPNMNYTLLLMGWQIANFHQRLFKCSSNVEKSFLDVRKIYQHLMNFTCVGQKLKICTSSFSVFFNAEFSFFVWKMLTLSLFFDSETWNSALCASSGCCTWRVYCLATLIVIRLECIL